jgi:hypothetical protein
MNTPVESIPSPPTVREKLARHVREGRLLRSLLPLSVRAAEECHRKLSAPPNRQPEGVKPLAAVPQERVAIQPGSNATHDGQAAPAETPLAFRKQESNRMCGVSSRLLERLLAIGKFVGSQEMQPETIISGAYTAMSAAYSMEATRPAEIFVATMYLGVAMIHLIVPYQRKGDRPAS